MFEKDKDQKTDPRPDTPRRIIEAAGEIFEDSGYEHATIRAICERASVNVAAINYHFGGKKNLYLAVLKFWRTKAFEKYPFDPAGFATESPEERLRAFVRTLLFRVLDEGEGSRFAKLISHEFVKPTGGLDMLVEETVRPLFSFLSTTVGQFFDSPPPEMTINLCCLSVAGQIFHLYIGRYAVNRLLHRESLSRQEIELVADHITRFSVYAIREIAASSKGESA